MPPGEDSTPIQELLQRGLDALNAGDYPAALSHWNRVLDLHPNHEKARRLVEDLRAFLARSPHTDTGPLPPAPHLSGSGRWPAQPGWSSSEPTVSQAMAAVNEVSMLRQQLAAMQKELDETRARYIEAHRHYQEREEHFRSVKDASEAKLSKALTSARARVEELEEAQLQHEEQLLELRDRVDMKEATLTDERLFELEKANHRLERRLAEANEREREHEIELAAIVSRCDAQIALAYEKVVAPEPTAAPEVEDRSAEIDALKQQLVERDAWIAALLQSSRSATQVTHPGTVAAITPAGFDVDDLDATLNLDLGAEADRIPYEFETSSLRRDRADDVDEAGRVADKSVPGDKNNDPDLKLEEDDSYDEDTEPDGNDDSQPVSHDAVPDVDRQVSNEFDAIAHELLNHDVDDLITDIEDNEEEGREFGAVSLDDEDLPEEEETDATSFDEITTETAIDIETGDEAEFGVPQQTNKFVTLSDDDPTGDMASVESKEQDAELNEEPDAEVDHELGGTGPRIELITETLDPIGNEISEDMIPPDSGKEKSFLFVPESDEDLLDSNDNDRSAGSNEELELLDDDIELLDDAPAAPATASPHVRDNVATIDAPAVGELGDLESESTSVYEQKEISEDAVDRGVGIDFEIIRDMVAHHAFEGDIEELDISPTAAYALSRIDGTTPCQDIVDLVGVEPDLAIETILDLLRRGIIRVTPG